MNQTFQGQRIILAMPADVGLYQCFLDNLQALGMDVLLLRDDDHFRYPSMKHRVVSILRKLFLGDRLYKKRLRKQHKASAYLDTLHASPGMYDHALFIRPDLFDTQVIRLAEQKSHRLCAYQWDGLDRFPDVCELIPAFHRFHVFDPRDAARHPNVLLSHNFYFDCYPDLVRPRRPAFDVYYLGGYDGRMGAALQLCEALHARGLKLKVIIRCSPDRAKELAPYPYITTIHAPLSYRENLAMVADAAVLLDIGHATLHNGLSFRPFEALGFGKKLITTNASITSYDFYNPRNVLVWGEGSEVSDAFLQSDYEAPPASVRDKYSFSGWLRQILG